ncbi:MAG: dihydrofolate reductase [Chitinophagaceae bacterium]|nr:MAG: dihydrofolate reductase [Chitinophagaceae bacterium]
MIINLVVAATENNVIGKNNQLLWHLPNDMAFFKNTTWGMPVIMGRKTYESLGKPLKGRTNIVITANPSFQPGNDVITAASLEEAITRSAESDAKECYVIGGGEIFKQSMSIANRIYMTRVHANLEGDTFFPTIDQKEWIISASTPFEADAKHAYSYTFEIWQRK